MKKVFFLTFVILLSLVIQINAADKKVSKPAKNVVTGIKFEVIPVENTVAFIDGKKIGEVSKIDVLPVKPGKHLLKLVHNKDEVEVEVVVANKQILNFKYAFEDSGKGIGGFSEEEKEDSSSKKKEESEVEKTEEKSKTEKPSE